MYEEFGAPTINIGDIVRYQCGVCAGVVMKTPKNSYPLILWITGCHIHKDHIQDIFEISPLRLTRRIEDNEG